jgi:hypothetical protein
MITTFLILSVGISLLKIDTVVKIFDLSIPVGWCVFFWLVSSISSSGSFGVMMVVTFTFLGLIAYTLVIVGLTVLFWRRRKLLITHIQRKTHTLFTGRITISRDEVLQIDYSKIEPKIKSLGYDCKNNTTNAIRYVFSRESITKEIVLKIRIYSNNNELVNSYISGYYISESPFQETDLPEKKDLLKERVNEVAEICNLTVDWSKAQWGVLCAE